MSPACVSFSFATAPMSPGPNSSAWPVSLPCGTSSWPIRSFEWLRRLKTCESGIRVPWYTRKRLIRPANGSASVLKTNATSSASGTGSSVTSPASTLPALTGDGRSSTSASRRRLVAMFLVATPQVMGNRLPFVTPSLSTVTISSCEISSPSR